MNRLARLYPGAWRDRYEVEFLALLEARPPSLLERLDIIRGAVDARIHPQLPGANPDRGARRRAGFAAAVGGALWVVAAIGFYGAPYATGMGYKDSGSAFLVGAAAAALTGIAAILVTVRMGERSKLLSGSSAAVLLGGIGLVLPWPLFVLGLFSTLLGTVVVGFASAARYGVAYIPLGFGALLAFSFNTEDARALLLVPLGLAWILVGAMVIRGGLASGPRAPAAT